MKNTKTIKTNMIIKDMKNAGFDSKENTNGNCVVSLIRAFSMLEVHMALLSAGYELGQYELSHINNSIVIKAK